MANFLRNRWYVACEADEIDERPLGRRILDETVVLYRSQDGKAAALHDRCPHRFVALSRGSVVSDNLKCVYHGLEFGPDGQCAENPHDGVINDRMRVKAYPTLERNGYVWIWMGHPERTDPSLLPRLPFIETPETFNTVRGHLLIRANYQLIADNLLDLSHVEFLHPLFTRKEGLSKHQTEFRHEGDNVIANRLKPNTSLNGFARLFWDFEGDRGDGRANMTWTPPGYMYFDLGTAEVGGDPQAGVCTPAAHLLTPETAFSTHYFWAQGRNRRLNDTVFDAELHAITSRVFEEEDKVVIEDQQRAMGQETDIFALRPLLLKSDAPTVMSRRIMMRLIREET